MRNLLVAVAIFAGFGAAPLAHAQGRVTPLLSTSMQRICQGNVRTHVLYDPTGRSSTTPQVANDTRTFRALRSADGYQFIQGAVMPGSSVELRASVTPNGNVTAAALVGSPGASDALAHALARDIPERVVMGRSFAPGDDFYAPDVASALLNDLTSSMGLPFPVAGQVSMPFVGLSSESGVQVLAWEGDMIMSGAGAVGDAQMALRGNFHHRVVLDAETGLVRESTLAGAVSLTRNGMRAYEMESVDHYVCQIIPQ